MSQIFRFLLGGGWWTIWYILFYLFTGTVNVAWFEELLQMTKRGESGPGAGAAYIGLICLSGLPVLFFSVIHLILGMRQATDSRAVLAGFSVLFLLVILVWMFVGSAGIAGATYPGFILYYLGFALITFINLVLLWIARHEMSLLSILSL